MKNSRLLAFPLFMAMTLHFGGACSSSDDPTNDAAIITDSAAKVDVPVTSDASTPDRASADTTHDAPRHDASVADQRADRGAPAHDVGAEPDVTSPDSSVDVGAADLGIDPAVVAALMDPDRPSAPHECAGTPLTRAEIVALFHPGYASFAVSYGKNGTMEMKSYERSCTSLTGCSDWQSKEVGSYSSLNVFAFYFASADATSLMAAPYDNYFNDVHVDHALPISKGDWIFATYPYDPPQRVRVTKLASGEICVSTATIVQTTGSPTEYQTYLAGRGIIPPPPASSQPGDLPAFSGFTPCANAEESQAAIVAAWFEPGSSNVDLRDATGSAHAAARSCHPITGCSLWADRTYDSSMASVTGLQISWDGQNIEAHINSSARHSYPVIVDGAFSGTVVGWQVDGIINTSCLSWRSLRNSEQTGLLYAGQTYTVHAVGRIER